LLRNRWAEKDIRDFLSQNGYNGRSAQFEELELHAVERPGWLQILRFSVRVKRKNIQPKAGEPHHLDSELLFGAMQDDERFKICKIQYFSNRSQRDALLDRWSTGLIQVTYSTGIGKSYSFARTVVELVVFVVLLGVVLSLLSLLS